MTTAIPIKDIRPGDILLHAGKGEISKLIQWVSDSDYSHAAMVYEEGKLAEAIASGVYLDHSLTDRVTDKDGLFAKIDVIRVVGGNKPLSGGDIAALQASARALKGLKFALNQMFELGVICAIKNKVPPTLLTKTLVHWAMTTLVQTDPTRLVCSEFVYRAYHNAKTQQAKLLDPTIIVTMPTPRPFPDIDYEKLLDEYWEAGGGVMEKLLGALPEPPSVAASVSDEQFAEAALATRKLLARSSYSVSTEQFDAKKLPLPQPNPALVLPQDLADSPTFSLLGRAVP